MKSFLHVGCGPKRKDRSTKKLNASECSELELVNNASVVPGVISSKASKHFAHPYCDQLTKAHFQ
jgi:hypothetical protein